MLQVEGSCIGFKFQGFRATSGIAALWCEGRMERLHEPYFSSWACIPKIIQSYLTGLVCPSYKYPLVGRITVGVCIVGLGNRVVRSLRL